jgi:AcrR family transcriptional regulator
VDPRIARTRASMQTALLELCREQEYADLSVSDIAEASGINRSTFYQHYADKEALLADALDGFVESAAAQLEAEKLNAPDADPRAMIQKFLEHVRENAALYRTVLGPTGSPVIVANLRERVIALALSGLSQAPRRADSPPLNIVAAGIAGSFISVVREWLSMKPLPSADRVTEWAWLTLTGAVTRPETAPVD